jgi:threonine 3-dehydrogenase
MSILITGGTGFIGAEIVRQLLGEETCPPIHVAHHSGNFQRISDLTDQVTLHQVDFGEPADVVGLVTETRPEVIFHFAAVLTGPGEANPQLAIQTNAFGTYALLEAARQGGVRQVVFASSIGSYGLDVVSDTIDDRTIQRPLTIYGVTKVFGEQLGGFYKRSFDLDFRGLRYPSIVGPGVKTPSVVQYTSWMIEESVKGNPFAVVASPELTTPILYFKDAAKAAIDLSRAPLERIQSVNYLVDGVKPTPSAAELADVVRLHVPGAALSFEPDPLVQAILDGTIKPLDDSCARDEWGWSPAYGLDTMVSDFMLEMELNSARYS